MSIGKLIIESRRSKRMSQAVLAEKIGVCRATLGNYERDVSVPNVVVLKRIADVLKVPLNLFLFSSDDTTYQEREELFIRLLREEDELYAKVMDNPNREIKKWKRYSKIDSHFIK